MNDQAPLEEVKPEKKSRKPKTKEYIALRNFADPEGNQVRKGTICKLSSSDAEKLKNVIKEA